MDEHTEVSEQRVDPFAVGRHEGQLVEGVGHHGCDRQEESKHQHHDAGGVREGVPSPFRRPPNSYRRHHREHHGNEEQRTLVAGVECDPGETVGHGQVAVPGNVGNLEIAADERNYEAARGHQQHHHHGVDGRPGAFHQRRSPPQLARNRSDGGVGGEGQRQPKADGA